ncbi:serine/threonine protein kinase [Aquabacterium sp. A7-Y]|uniref:RAD55 family ATPase n=1 Tax=Aquabacterium sp. A7-Y TaxID=1349605 RepID=UPI00223E7554|nr:ATPase domain-containing protein [Aquabacterium sp. A7-Y]MCW7537345.1 serine/threonine protein kinase [Aquabacterium sp. A7-Y]
MTQPDSDAPQTLSRLPAGVPGLDELLGGGLIKAGVYIVQGSPGAGKTILANQICFNQVARGGRVVYVTMLAESHARLFQHLQAMSFFDPAAVPQSIHYVSGFNALRDEGLAGVVKLLRTEMRESKANVLVLDGLVMAATAAASEQDLKLFISDIQAHAVLSGCTTLLLTSDAADRPVSAEQTMVDGILLMRERAYGPRRERNIEVVKFRGSATLRGNHAFRIGADGIVVYPRFESAHRESPGGAIELKPVSTGIPGLDDMIALRGVPEGSITAISGDAGSGKTVLALHFAACASVASPALFFSFYESPEFLMQIGREFGLDLAAREAEGSLTFAWHPLGENMLDELAYRLLDAVRQTGARRVVIDSLGGFLLAPAYGERGDLFLASLANELRRAGVTTLVTMEESDPRRESRLVSTPSLSALSDNVLNLRLQHGTFTRRFASIGKMRGTRYSQQTREVVLTAGGLRIGLDDPAVDHQG